jgi:hypothetical protein
MFINLFYIFLTHGSAICNNELHPQLVAEYLLSVVLGGLSSLSAVSYLQPSDHARFPAYARYAPLIL